MISLGPLTVMGGVEALAFVRTKYAQNATYGLPDIEFHFVSGSTNSDGGERLRYAHGLTDQFYESVFKPIESFDTFSIFPMLLRPRSTGRIMLRSSKPFDYPLIYPNYFQDDFDMKTLIEGVKIAIAISLTNSFRQYGATFNPYLFPDCKKNFPLFSDEFIECMIRYYTATIYHPAGTCKMGPDSKLGAVVNANLSVHHVSNLRVIDASIMPNVVSGNTNAPVIMIAEKGADLIKQRWFNYYYNYYY